MAVRKGSATWKGDLKGGSGSVEVGDAWTGSYSFESRFEEGDGTNPEELIGAAHAACYSMQLSAMLAEEGHPADAVTTTAKVDLRIVDEKPTIVRIALTVEGEVPGVSETDFREAAVKAKDVCLVTRALAGVQEITLDASLKG